MEPINEESLTKGYRLAIYICCALIASVFLCAAGVEFLVVKNAPFHGFRPLPTAGYDKVRLIFLGAVLVTLAPIPYLRKGVLAAARRAGTAPVFPTLPEPVARLVYASTLSFTLCQSIAAYGLILFLCNGVRADFYLFLGIALVTFALFFPRFERWKEWLQNEKLKPE